MSADSNATTLFAQQYNTGITLLSQQMMAEMLEAIDMEPDGGPAERVYADQVGIVRMQTKEGRATDVPIVATPTARRAIDPQDGWIGDYIDRFDKLKTLNDPENATKLAQAAAGVRFVDKVIIDAIRGTALTGKAGGTSVTFPAAQQIAAGGAGFTLTKLKQGVRMLKGKNVIRKGMTTTLHCAWTAKQEEEFINTTEVKSSDFTKTKTLDMGGVDEFYRVKFHLIEDVSNGAADRMLPLAGTTRSCFLWAKRGVRGKFWQRPKGEVDWVATKKSWLVTNTLSFGATRMEEEQAVQIDVVES